VTSAIQAPPSSGADSSAAVPALPQPPVAAVPALGGAVAAPGPALSAPSTGGQASTAVAAAPAAPEAVPYTPMSAMLSSDQVAEMFGGALPATRGEWVEQHFYSAALGREDAYMVWLPPGYSADTKSRYPSLYLLHGVGGPEGNGVEEWLGYSLTEDLDRMMALGLIEPMIVILPNGEQGYWMNHSPDTDGAKWADFVAKDLVKDVDAHFRTDARREKRGIGGLSMGGHGALQIAMNHPDEFSVVGAHSPTIRPFETSPEFFGDQQWFARYDPITLAEKTDAASKLAIWIDAGNEDPWLPMTEELDSILEAKKDNVQMHVLEGAHEGWYWEYYLPEYLNFYSSALTATATTPKGAPVVPSRSLLASAGVVTQTSS
jgi:enterochelin esterase-like enzyme